MVYLLPFLSYLAGSKSVSARPHVRHGYDDKYRSRNYSFVERQKYSVLYILFFLAVTFKDFFWVSIIIFFVVSCNNEHEILDWAKVYGVVPNCVLVDELQISSKCHWNAAARFTKNREIFSTAVGIVKRSQVFVAIATNYAMLLWPRRLSHDVNR